MSFETFTAQWTVSGTIRWNRSIGRPKSVPPHAGLKVTYHYTYTTEPLDWKAAKHREISHTQTVQIPTMDFDMEGDEYVVGFWGPNMVNPSADGHAIEVTILDYPWSQTSRHQPFRLVDPPQRSFDPVDAVTLLDPFEIYAPILGVDV